MTSNESKMLAMVANLRGVNKRVFDGCVVEATRSIVEGSELTGAPGQPVDTGADKASFHTEYEHSLRATIGTNIVYAENIEEGLGSHGQPVVYGPGGHGRSTVGGSGSVKLTAASMPRILDYVTRQVLDGAGGWSGEDGG